MLVLFTVHEARADFLPNYFVYNGGLCQSYDSTLPGTLVKLEPCILWNPKHYNWALVIPKDAPLICIGGTSICTHVADDGKIYLKKMDETDESQKWLPHDTLPDRYTNSLTGSNFCTQAMHNHGDKDKPFTDYLQMQPCSVSNVNQILLFAGAPKLRLANYFRYPFYQTAEILQV